MTDERENDKELTDEELDNVSGGVKGEAQKASEPVYIGYKKLPIPGS